MQQILTLKELRALVAPYAHGTNTRGLFEVLLTLTLFFSSATIGVALSKITVLGGLLVAIPTAFLLVRLFILQHDAGHRSLCKNQTLNIWVGRVLAMLALTPFSYWRRVHHMHHRDTGRLDVKRNDGVLWVLTENEFHALPKMARAAYRIYHMPIILFFVGPVLYFMLYYRLFWLEEHEGDRRSMLATNAALCVAGGMLYSLLGAHTLLVFILPMLGLTAMIGVWLFFVQHTFEYAYFAHDDTWDKRDAIVRGSSYYKLSRFAEWLTASIGYHALHHLNPSIPSYRLRECWEKVRDAFHETPTFTLRESLHNVGFALWSERAGRMIRIP